MRVALGLACLIWVPVIAEAQERPTRDAAGYLADVTGVWRSPDYGLLAEIRRDGLSLYHEAGGLCLPDARDAEAQAEGFAVWSPVEGPVAEAVFAEVPGGTPYLFEGASGVPAACHQKLTPAQRFDFAVATLRQHYAGFAARHIDPEALLAEVRQAYPVIDTDDALWGALSRIFIRLNDPHSELHGVIGGVEIELAAGEAPTLTAVGDAAAQKTWLAAYRDGILSGLLRGQGHHVGNNRLFWGVRDGVGYLNIVTMGAFDAKADPSDTQALEAILDEALTAFQGTRAVVVDVSNNRGGYDSVSRTIAARFYDQPRLAYQKRPWREGQTTTSTSVVIQPSSRVRYTGPVYVVTSDITVSAGEIFALAMRALPQVRLVGSTTRAALSDQIEKPLGEGWRFSLSGELYTNPQGEVPEGRGIVPDTPWSVFEGRGHAANLAAFIDGLKP